MTELYDRALQTLAGTHGWLTPFIETVDDEIHKILPELALERIKFDPYNTDRLLADVVRLLDECLAWRREIQDLEARAFERAVSYELLRKVLPFDETLASEAPSETYLKLLGSAYSNAAAKLASASQKLEQSHAALYTGLSGAAAEEKESRSRRIDAVKEKGRFQIAAQDRLEAQHTHEGHALNYKDRRLRLLKYLLRDFREAFLKSSALSAGLKQVYRMERPLPALKGKGPIDLLSDWCSGVMEALEYERLTEIEFQRVISLHTPHRGSDRKPKLLSSDADFGAVTSMTRNGLLTVNLADAFQTAYGPLRLRGVGMSMSCDKPAEQGRNALKLSAIVFPPPQPYLFGGDNTKYRKPPIPLSDVGIFRSDVPVEYGTSPNIFNIDPKGQWQIYVEPFYHYYDNSDRSERWAHVHDLKLHLLLAANPARESDAWVD